MSVLLAGAQLIFPYWVPQFINAMSAYRQYTGGAETTLDVLLTPLLGRIVGGCLILLLLVVCWRQRKSEPGSLAFTLMTSMVLAVTITAIPKVAPYNHLLLLPAVFFIVQGWVPFKALPRASQGLMTAAAIMLIWPWVASIALSVLYVFLPVEVVLRGWMAPLYTSVGMPAAVVALLIPNILAMIRQSPPHHKESGVRIA